MSRVEPNGAASNVSGSDLMRSVRTSDWLRGV